MKLTLVQERAISELAVYMKDWLPGSGARQWKGHVTFESLAKRHGLGQYWTTASKHIALRELFGNTLQYKQSMFQPLVLDVVKEGLTYTAKQGRPLTVKDLDVVNGLITEIGFKFPDLWDPQFRESIGFDAQELAKRRIDEEARKARLEATKVSERSISLRELEQDFIGLVSTPNRQDAGLKLESLLNRLFTIEGLHPREAFRITGEQIDGAFKLDQEIYLLEAKWQNAPLPEADLLIFREKIKGKSAYTRGLFVSINDFSNEAKAAITTGKQANFFAMNGHDLLMILREAISLKDYLQQRQRILAEEGRMFVQFDKLSSGSRTGSS